MTAFPLRPPPLTVGVSGALSTTGTVGTLSAYRKPKLAAIDYTTTVDAARVNLSARFDYVLRDHKSATVWQPGGSLYTFAGNVLAQNPNCKIGAYLILSQCDVTVGSYTIFANAMNGTNGEGATGGWWVYLAGTTTKTNYDTAFAGWYETNQTNYVPADSTGRRWPEVAADGFSSTFFSQAHAAGRLHFVMNDNVWHGPRADDISGGTVAGDYNRDGVNEACTSGRVTNTTIKSEFRKGYIAFWNRLRANLPGLLISGNSDADFSTFLPSVSTAELTAQCDIPLLEGFIGQGYSIDTYNSFANNMVNYRSAIANKRAGGTVFVLCRLDSTGWSSSKNYRMARYGLCTTMLDDGHYMPGDQPGGGSHRPIWFDDFEAPIGAPTEAAPTAARNTGVWAGKGLWARDYENGLVISNPGDNKGRYMGNAPGGLTLARSGNVVTLTWSGLSGHGRQVGDRIRIEDCTTDATFNGTFQITAFTTTSLSWSQTGTNASLTNPEGTFSLQTTVDLTGLGLKRLTTTNDAANNYNGTLGSGTPVYTSQNNGTAVTTLTLWARDGIVLVRA